MVYKWVKIVIIGLSICYGKKYTWHMATQDKVSFPEVKTKCENNQLDPLMLHTPEDYEEFYASLKDMIPKGGDRDIWVGLEKNHTTGTYQWLDGTFLEFANWNNEEPKQMPERRCGVINAYRFWETALCTAKRSLVCQNQVSGNYELYDGAFDFYEASLICTSDDSHLPVVKDDNDQQRLVDKASNAWLGLIENDNHFNWINETPLPRYVWEKNEDGGHYVHAHRLNKDDNELPVDMLQIHAPDYEETNRKPRCYVCQTKPPIGNYEWIDHYYIRVADDAVMYYPPRQQLEVRKRTRCGMECAKDPGCYQYTFNGSQCKTFSRSDYMKSPTLGVPLFRRKKQLITG